MRSRSFVELGIALLLTGCTTQSVTAPATSGTESSTAVPSQGPTAPPSPTPTRVQAGGLIRATTGPDWTAAGLGGPTFAAGFCRYRRLPDGQYLPDPRCTPGAIDTTVNDATLGSTICRSGYTKTVRPPYSLTGPAKQESLLEYGSGGQAPTFEYDHLIPLELGGSSSTWNLWPEPNIGGSGGYYINPKDKVENDLKRAVCAGRASLRAAQLAIVSNWETAEAVLGL